jgi:hypothetical protein
MNRRLRGVLGTALVWGVGWSAIGLGAGWLQVVALRLAGISIPMAPARLVILVALRWAVFGVVAGSIFALALWYVGRRAGSLAALSPRRAAAWGAGAGVVLPLCVVALLAAGGAAVPLAAVLMLVVTGGVFGAGTAAGTVAVARRAPEPLGVARDMTALAPPVA